MKRNCPVCSNEQKKHLYKQEFSNNGIFPIDYYNVTRCESCGFVFADDLPSKEAFDQYYKNLSKYEDKTVVSPYDKDYLQHIVSLLGEYCHKEASILDMGCSYGLLLSVFKSKGFTNILGLDPSASCARRAKALFDINVTTGTFAEANFDKKFDLIILNDVLEHIIDLQELFFKLSTMLCADGVLYIKVPDAENFYKNVFCAFQQFSVEHINYFTAKSLQKLLNIHSFYIERIERIGHKFGSSGVIDPDLLIIARKSTSEIGEQNILQYIAESLKKEEVVKQKLAQIKKEYDKLIVWGVGTHTQHLIGKGYIDPAKIAFFVDANEIYFDKKLYGLDIKSPAVIKTDEPILISSYNYKNDILNDIKKLNLTNKVIVLY